MGIKRIVCLLSGVALAAGLVLADESVLRRSWSLQSAQKARLLRQATARMEKLMLRWSVEPKLREAPGKDPDVRWMLDNAYAAYLVLDEELARKPSGSRRSAALYLTARLARRNLGQYLPALLVDCDSDEERLEVMRCMAALRDATSLGRLETFLVRADEETNEALLVVAVQGLGLSRQPRYLPTISSVRQWFTSPRARLEGAKAAWRCGDRDALAEVGELLHSPDLEVRGEAIGFLRENFCAEALAMLAGLARTAGDRKVAAKAVEAIIEGSNYGEPLPGEQKETTDPPELDDLVDPAAGLPEQPEEPPADATPGGLPPDLSKLSAQELQELLQRMETWWTAEGAELFEKRRQTEDVS